MILANSNPATIMTDPATADRTYVEPLDPEVLTAIIEKERPDALLPTLGGQTALNLTMQLVELGVLERYGVEVIGARPEAISTAEDRDRFKAAMEEIGLEVPRSGFAHSLHEAEEIAEDIGFPIMVRPSFILGGQGDRHRRGRRTHFAPAGRRGAGGQPGGPDPGRAVDRRLEGVRARGDARRRRQLRRRLLHRELRPHGRAHRRLHHGGAGADAHRRRVPGHARRRLRLPAPGRGRDRRLQRAVRRGPVDRTARHHRDEPPGLALLGAGLEGHGLSHRQDRGPPGRRLPPRRDPQRHHPGHPGLVRADHRLRGHQDPALGLREAPRRRRPPRAPACSRWARSWPSAARSASRCRRRCARWSRAGPGSTPTPPRRPWTSSRDDELVERVGVATPERIFELEAALRRGVAVDDGRGPHRHRPVVRPPAGAHRGRARSAIADAPAARARPTSGGPSGSASPTPSWPTCAGATAADVRAARLAARRAGDLQDGRHLRGRVRGLHAVPLRHLRGGGRGPPLRARPGRSSSARGPTASARASSSTTAASTPPWRCATPATRR